MSVQDIRSNLLVITALQAQIVGNVFASGIVIDTAHNELGTMFDIQAPNADYTDGTYTLSIQESEEQGFGNFTEILEGSDKLIGTLAGMVLSSGTPIGSVLQTIGVISTLRYVRVGLTGSSVTTGALLIMNCTQKGELKPVV